jgi:(1->4)-alpha-D-glucan 1-alpha-D-glucosylmutase
MLDDLAPLLDAPEPEALRAMVEAQGARAKLFVTARLLRLRRERPALFEGDYRALEPEGEGADGWLAFARQTGSDALVALVPRAAAQPASLPLPDDLAGTGWTEWLTGVPVSAGPALEPSALPLPWAVLVRA